jgi:hypothetical protein
MIDPSKIYTTKNNGDFRILNYNKWNDVVVEFLSTGFVTSTRSDLVLNGKVKDHTRPSVFGIGFIGVGAFRSGGGCYEKRRYKVWASMLERCYSDARQRTNPTYVGCSVCVEWHDFQIFAKWYNKNYIKGYQLDKDIRVCGNKVYSPDLCMFVTARDNTEKAHAKSYTFLSPLGVATCIYNLSKFCRENELNHRCMAKVYNGVARGHKGWMKIK